MGIEGIEELAPDESPAPPLPDDEAVEEQKREEEGIEPSEPIEVSDPGEENSEE